MKTIPFPIASKKNQIPRSKFTKDMNDLCKENYKLLNKEIKEDYRRWKDLLFSWIGRISIVKMAILLKTIYIFNSIPIKVPMAFSQRLKNVP
jgi:hypothetical protein